MKKFFHLRKKKVYFVGC